MQTRRGRGNSARPELSKKISEAVVAQSILFREISAEREEIMRHKWYLSEQAGYDVGYARAMYDWITNHRAAWRKAWRAKTGCART